MSQSESVILSSGCRPVPLYVLLTQEYCSSHAEEAVAELSSVRHECPAGDVTWRPCH